MAFFDDVKKIGKNLAQKSSEMVEVTKINMNISTEKDKIQKIYTQIGEAVYNDFKAGNQVAYAEQCTEIQQIEAVVAELQAKVLELKNELKCPSCGADVTKGVAFCPKCGAKLGE